MFKSFTAVLLLGVTAFAVVAYQNCGSRSVQATNAAGVASPGSNNEPVTITGKISQENLDGCKYLFYDESNQPYQLVNLSPDLKVDGKRLKMDVVPRDDMVTTCMKGSVIEVIKAEEIP